MNNNFILLKELHHQDFNGNLDFKPVVAGFAAGRPYPYLFRINIQSLNKEGGREAVKLRGPSSHDNP